MDRKKLDSLLAERGLSLNAFAKECGVSRQSLYNMFHGRSILSTPMRKVLSFLHVGIEDVVEEAPGLETVLAGAPDSIVRSAGLLRDFAIEHGAELFLIGSRARGKKGITSDWDFAVYFPTGDTPAGFASLKLDAVDAAFPYRVDVVLLGNAPDWFIKSIEEDAVCLTGGSSVSDIMRRIA